MLMRLPVWTMMAPRPVCIRMDRRRSEEERGEVLKRFREKGKTDDEKCLP